MAVFCLANDIMDLKERLARIIVAYDLDGQPVTAGQLKAQGAMAALLKDALKPNLVQSLEGTPAFVHGGPFANIAHGCNSVIATKMGCKLADYSGDWRRRDSEHDVGRRNLWISSAACPGCVQMQLFWWPQYAL